MAKNKNKDRPLYSAFDEWLRNRVGNLTTLLTGNKNSVVEAINEQQEQIENLLQAGKEYMPAGTIESTVIFNKPFSQLPVVSVGIADQNDRRTSFAEMKITDVFTTGFKIQRVGVDGYTHTVHWIATQTTQ